MAILELFFKDEENKPNEGGPSAPNRNIPPTPGRGRYNTLPQDRFIHSNDSDREGDYRDGVVWRRGDKKYDLDPSVWIKK